MRRYCPIQVYWQLGVERKQVYFAIGVIRRVLKLAGMFRKIRVERIGLYELEKYKETDDGLIEWYGKYDALKIIDDYKMIKSRPYYKVILMAEEIFMDTEEKNRKDIVGLAQKEHMAIIYVGKDKRQKSKVVKRLTAAVIVHEIGHIFSLPADERREEEIVLSPINYTRHCANQCVMYHTLSGTMKFSEKFFCSTCLAELNEYFSNK